MAEWGEEAGCSCVRVLRLPEVPHTVADCPSCLRTWKVVYVRGRGWRWQPIEG